MNQPVKWKVRGFFHCSDDSHEHGKGEDDPDMIAIPVVYPCFLVSYVRRPGF